MIIQEIIAFSLLGVAVYFLYRKFFVKKKKSKKNCGDSDCGCG
ncbi:FeoB-associated Cys-rich membrane protein [Flavobacterium humi]|uniref:FeoB-associated Cys-rich membrane protein n=1 Tax=Flavobacterium humi TaxID=2562683 RepID=A0A4Z0L6B9_9FLAO|nr:FeoB-associated Cys-rich membrane protein [Flavobacterium humi]